MKILNFTLFITLYVPNSFYLDKNLTSLQALKQKLFISHLKNKSKQLLTFLTALTKFAKILTFHSFILFYTFQIPFAGTTI